MAMTVVVTRNVTERYRGFLLSCMLEIAAGVYTSPRLSAAVRERIWKVCQEWACDLNPESGIVMTWFDGASPQKQRVLTIGAPPLTLVDYDGFILCRRD